MPRKSPRRHPETVEQLKALGVAPSSAERVADLPPELLFAKWSGKGQHPSNKTGFPKRIEAFLNRWNREHDLDEYDSRAYRWFYAVFVEELDETTAERLSAVEYNDRSEWEKRVNRSKVRRRSKGNRRAYKD